MKIFTNVLLFSLLIGCAPNIQKVSPVNSSSKTIATIIRDNTSSRTKFPIRTKAPTNTITLTPNITNILKITSISEYLLTNKDNLQDNPRYSIAFENIDIYKEERAYPEIDELCQRDCESITWDKRLTVSLYLLWNANNPRTYLQLLRAKLFEEYPGMKGVESEIVNHYLNSISPEYQGWASYIYQTQYLYAEYFATYYGPILILISRKTECVDLCTTEYPLPQILLAEMQLEKIFTLTK
jgi:hypothetical protein